MPYTAKHKQDTRRRILESARRLFNSKGFAEVSIGEIMAKAGLTHGGFYRHFNDKSELYAEAVQWFLCEEAPKPWQRRRSGDAVKAAYQDVLQKLLGLLQADLAGSGARERALSLVALCVGGMVVARSVEDPALAHDLRRAAYRRAQTVLKAAHADV